MRTVARLVVALALACGCSESGAVGAYGDGGRGPGIVERVVVAPDAPADAPSRFRADVADVSGDPLGPRIVYPSHETMFPRNLQRVLHQWRADEPLDLFEVRFESDVAKIRVYTSARTYLPDAEVWRWLAEAHAGGSVKMTVRALATTEPPPARIYTSQTIDIYYSASEVIGALYYWSTGAQGVMRATLSSPVATKFFTDPESDDDTCVACHTVSRDGRRLAVGYGGERLREVTIPDREVRIPTGRLDPPDYGWGTFNPGATRLLYANKGLLRLLDAETGDEIAAVTLPSGSFATHPDWSPDGRYVAIAYGTRAPGNKSAQGTSLARMAVNGDGTFGAPEVLVASTADDDTIVWPSYSPDSRWLAFVRAQGASKDNETSRMYLMAADGSGAPIALARLNERVRDEDGIADIGNTMPTWAPSTRVETFWLAFSSLRDYGDVLAGEARDQLWGAAIDPARIAMGADPSYAAFWMPFQSIEDGNHRAFWALNPEDTCPSSVEICDGVDNDCDAIVDETCCMLDAEVCGDGADNDCDGVADEGCGCMDVESCTNGIDDDCDTLVDSADEDCLI